MIPGQNCTIIKLIGISALALHAAAATSSASTGTNATVAALQDNLEYLKKQAAMQQETVEKLRQSQHSAIERRKAERTRLAGQLMDNQLELKRLEREKERLEQQFSTLKKHSKYRDAVRDLGSRTQQLAEQLSVYFGETFGHRKTVARLDEVMSLFKSNKPDQDHELLLKSYGKTLDAFMDLRAGAGSVRALEQSIRTADGLMEDVRLLTAGDISYAYETLKDGRIGITIASPEDATGLRWTEDVSRDTKRQIQEAFRQIVSDGKEIVSPPMDVTGRLRLDSDLGRQSLQAQFHAGGPIMFPLAGLAALAMLLIAERVIILYGRNSGGSRRAGRVLDACSQNDFETAERLLEKESGIVDRVLRACLQNRNNGAQAMEDAIQEQLLHQIPRLRRFLSGLGIIAAVAPLLGLLGTITGIIDTFGVIRAFGNANPELMAGGISEALLTTATGLVIAIPVLLCRGMLRGRMEKLIGDSERHAASMLNILSRERES